MILLLSYNFFGTTRYVNIGATPDGIVTAFCDGLQGYNHFAANTQYKKFEELEKDGYNLEPLYNDPMFDALMDLDKQKRAEYVMLAKLSA